MQAYTNETFKSDENEASKSANSIKEAAVYEEIEMKPIDEKIKDQKDRIDDHSFVDVELHNSNKPESEASEDGGYDIGMGRFVVEDPKEDRPAWDNQVQFILACVAYAVGLGNIWRFPYLAQIYGGGAFLIPYIIMLIFEGVPLFLMELAIGQRLRQGAIGVWNQFHPYLRGIGIGSMVISFTVGLYYNTIIAWCLWYIFNSFQDPLPYATCPLNANKTGYVAECENSGTTDYFWYRQTLDISPSMDDTGGIVWWIAICLVLAWSIIWVTMVRGIESSGKAMYVTATFPYLVLLIFLGQGLSLKGSAEGVAYLFTPDLTTLQDPRVWLDAATQIFYSLGLGFGGVIAFASYNPKRQDCQRDALIIALTNSFTSIFASIVIFAILGYKSQVQVDKCLDGNINILLDAFDLPEGSITYDNYDAQVQSLNNTLDWAGQPVNISSLNLAYCDLQDVLSEASQGTGLVFVVFPEAIINMPISPLWSILFFLMLLSLGLGSMFGTVEGVVTPLFDLGLTVPKPVLSGAVCLVSCAIGLLFATGAGNYWLDIFNNYAGSIPLLIVAFFELAVVSWGYGLKNFDMDLAWMIGPPKSIGGWILHWYFRLCWLVISPVLLLVVFGAYLYTTATGTLTYSQWVGDGSTIDNVEYPWFGVLVIILLIVLPLVAIPIIWIYAPTKEKCTDGDEPVGIMVNKNWKRFFHDLAFWENKY